MTAGRFITFEGGEGSGKSTQARRLAAHLGQTGFGVLITREPGGSPFAERLRALILDPQVEHHAPLAEALLFSAARADHLDQMIRPALADGRFVICDRFSDSTRVYQGFAGNLESRLLEDLEAIVVGPTRPDLTIIIDVPAATGLERARQRHAGAAARAGASSASDRFEARDLAFHERLRDGFLEIARREPQRCVVVDGTKAQDAVAEEVWAAVSRRLLEGMG